jgi:rhodanese-related sulfurtransferase
MNKKGYENVDKVIEQGLTALNSKEFETAAEATGALILDTRDNGDFAKGFIPQSVNIGLNGDFAPWVGDLVADVKLPILLVTYPGAEEETITRLTRIGFDHVIGYIDGGFESWKADGNEVDTVNRIAADEFKAKLKIGESVVYDVRKSSEYEAEHVEEAYSRPLASINDWVKDINPKEHFFLHCAGGYRSMIAASILQSRGYRNFTEIEGGFKAIDEAGVAKTDFVCQSKVMK